MDETLYTPVSIGETCVVKFQIARALNAAGAPGQSEMRMRLEMAPPARGERYFGWDVFDWLGISLDAVCRYIETDFTEGYRLEDLELGQGVVIDRLTGANHVHDYESTATNHVITQAVVEAEYPTQRKRFERRAAAFLERLRQPGDFLYIHSGTGFPSHAQVDRLLTALTGRNPDHRVRLLLSCYQEHDLDYAAYGDRVIKTFRSHDDNKPVGREWEGDDEAWAEALAPFKLQPRTAAKAPAAATPVPETAAPAAKPGILGRLFGR